MLNSHFSSVFLRLTVRGENKIQRELGTNHNKVIIYQWVTHADRVKSLKKHPCKKSKEDGFIAEWVNEIQRMQTESSCQNLCTLSCAILYQHPAQTHRRYTMPHKCQVKLMCFANLLAKMHITCWFNVYSIIKVFHFSTTFCREGLEKLFTFVESTWLSL